MKTTLRYCILAGFLSAILFQIACKKTPTDKVQGGPKFSLDSFDAHLRSSMEPAGAIGWGYAISLNGLFVKGNAYGKSRNDADGNLAFTLNKKVNIASVTKFLTAIAVLQLLERRGLDETSKIGQWLPPSWNQGPGVNNLTFGHLLGHTSGLSSANAQFTKTLGYTGLRLCIDTGVINTQTYLYRNANFALFRILIPSLWRGLNDAPTISAALDSATTENNYILYMQQHVFEPIGLNNISCEPESRGTSTLYYATTDLQANNGAYYGSWTSTAGGGGFFMTVMELARVMAYYKHTEVLLSKESRKLMEDNRYGLDRLDPAREIHGNYYGKNGSISSSIGQGTLEQVVSFPNGIEIVVMFNTQGMVFAGGTTDPQNAIYDAYNKSWY
ncbi:MAG: serine hydrolase [Bacteroidetes bacterium]|nr:serine hydrolase [Bacteroidota bacterium]